MSRWIPCKRREFIRRLRVLGFDGPFSGARQLRMMLRETAIILGRDISLAEWERL